MPVGFGRGGGRKTTADLLNKVNSQLKGEKIQKDTDDGLGDYLSSLGKNKPVSIQPNWDKFGEEDLSLSSDDGKIAQKDKPSPGSRFLKKKTTPVKEEPKKPAATLKPAAGRGTPSSLAKGAEVTSKYSIIKTKSEIVKFSDSELDDMSGMTSLDEDFGPPSKPAIPSTAKPAAKKPETKKPETKKPEAKKPEPKKPQKPSYGKAKNIDDMSTPDISLSEDSDLGGFGGASKFLKKPAVPTYAVSDDDSFGQTGNRFMKKKPAPAKKQEEIDEEIHKEEEKDEPAAVVISPKKKTKDQFALKSAERHSANVVLDSDDESLQNFMDGLSPAGGSPKRARSPHMSPSPPTSPVRTPKGILKTPRIRTPTMEYISEEDEDKSNSLKESLLEDEDSFKLNIMDAADLLGDAEVDDEPEPMPQKPPPGNRKPKADKAKVEAKPQSKAKQSNKKEEKSKMKKDPASDLLSSFGLQSVDDLLGGMNDDDDDDDIKTEQYDSDPPSRPTTPLRSILSPSPRPLTPRSGRSRVRLSLKDVQEASPPRSPSPDTIHTSRTRTPSVAYTDDFSEDESLRTVPDDEDSDRTLSPRGGAGRSRKSSYSEYSEDFTSEMTSPRRRRKSTSSRRSSRDSTYSTFSDTFSDSGSATPDSDSSPRSPRPRSSRPAPVMTSTQVQTGLDVGDMIYQWNQNMASLPLSYPLGVAGARDPALISTQVVGRDVLEAMTTFSPSVLALNELLRSHVEMTRNFLETQQRMHASLVETTYPDFQYTTLEDTKKYIKDHKKKRLTFNEALRQVKEEMGMNSPTTSKVKKDTKTARNDRKTSKNRKREKKKQ